MGPFDLRSRIDPRDDARPKPTALGSSLAELREPRCNEIGDAANRSDRFRDSAVRQPLIAVNHFGLHLDGHLYALPARSCGHLQGLVSREVDLSHLEEQQQDYEKEYLGNLDDHFTLLPFEKRYKAAHVAKILRCNWKIAQEAFMEAYHTVATHPTILDVLGDANTKYDVFGNYSRASSW